MPKSGKIYEAELVDAFANKAVGKINIIQTSSNKYQLVIKLTWKEGDWKLATTRNSPREWVSLDRLISHILKNYSNFFSPINLILSTEVSNAVS